MKITLEHIPGQELEVILRGDTESKEAKQVLATLNHASSFGKLMLQDEDESFLVDPADIKRNLLMQLTAPVRWTATVKNMLADGAREFIEVGPGTALQGMVKRVDPEANAHSAEGAE